MLFSKKEIYIDFFIILVEKSCVLTTPTLQTFSQATISSLTFSKYNKMLISMVINNSCWLCFIKKIETKTNKKTFIRIQFGSTWLTFIKKYIIVVTQVTYYMFWFFCEWAMYFFYFSEKGMWIYFLLCQAKIKKIFVFRVFKSKIIDDIKFI